MARKKLRDEQNNLEPDMTPMLDIVFILLIFFIVTTSFIKEEGLLVNRPKLNQASSDNSPTMLIQISETGVVMFNGKLVDVERLPARIENFIAKNDSNSAVVIPQYNTRHEDVVHVIDQIKSFEQSNRIDRKIADMKDNSILCKYLKYNKNINTRKQKPRSMSYGFL